MELKEVNYQYLVAKEGHVLTQAAADTPLLRRTFAKKIALAVGVDVDRYTEIPVAEAETIKKQQQEERRKLQVAEQRERRLAELQRELAMLENSVETEQ